MCSALAGERVLIVVPSLLLGGAERQALLLAQGLRERHGAEVTLWGLREPGPLAARCEALGLAWRLEPCAWPAGYGAKLAVLARFARRLAWARPSVLLPFTWLPNVLCGLSWRPARARLCLWNQRDLGLGPAGLDLRDRPPGRAERLALALTPRRVANAAHVAAALARRARCRPEQVALIPNAVALAAPQAGLTAWRTRLRVPAGGRLAAMLGNLHGHKDQATLLRAWPAVLAGQPDAVLALAGRPAGRERELQQQAAALGVAAAVRWLGPVDDVSGLLAACDLALFSSPAEGLPNGVLEPMAAGLALVASDNQGVRAALGPLADQQVFAPGDAAACARRCCALLADPEQRARLGQANAARAAACFSLPAMVDAYAAVLGEAR